MSGEERILISFIGLFAKANDVILLLADLILIYGHLIEFLYQRFIAFLFTLVYLRYVTHLHIYYNLALLLLFTLLLWLV